MYAKDPLLTKLHCISVTTRQSDLESGDSLASSCTAESAPVLNLGHRVRTSALPARDDARVAVRGARKLGVRRERVQRGRGERGDARRGLARELDVLSVLDGGRDRDRAGEARGAEGEDETREEARTGHGVQVRF